MKTITGRVPVRLVTGRVIDVDWELAKLLEQEGLAERSTAAIEYAVMQNYETR